MKKEKNLKLEDMKIIYIGDELKFQRLYYNQTHSLPIELGDCNAKGNYEVLGVRLAELLYENDIIEKEKEEGISEKVLKVIEENNYKIFPTCKNDNSSVLDPSTHYFEMYYMFKIYGYLDDYDIFQLFKKYDVLAELEKMKKYNEVLPKKKEILLKKIEQYKKNCILEYEEKNEKIFTDLKFPTIIVDINDMRTFLQEDIENIEFLSNKKIFEDEIYIQRHSNHPLRFPRFRKIMLENFKNMSEFQKKCVSLEIGKETGFIADVLNDKISYVTLETIQKILRYLNLQNSDMYYFINKRIQKKSPSFDVYKRLRKFEDI